MPVLLQMIIRREDLRRNPRVLYVFGDNVMRKGLGGQAAEMRFEPNGVGVATKYRPDLSPPAFFREDDRAIERQKTLIDDDMAPLFEHVKKGGIVVWPTRGIGTERADLQIKSPTTFDYLQSKFSALIKVGELFDKGEFALTEAMAEKHL